ncbi:MAG TPA: OmpA family protein [Methylophilaceae bacterium]|jgi:OOP family OmpA-OmpF porin
MRFFISLLLCMVVQGSLAETALSPQNSSSENKPPIVISGTVPDEATHQKLIAKVRQLYGENINDQIVIGRVMMPPNWTDHLDKLIDPQLKQITHGELKVEGTQINIRGEVANEAQRQQIVSDMSTRLNPTYTIHNGLHVTARGQSLIDDALANRNIEFESGSANLTPAGKVVLDEVATAMLKLETQYIDITGHTDSSGLRSINIDLSLARAQSVKEYLVSKGIKPEHCNTYGVGPDHPIESNTTVEGRSRNRRIEFRLVQKN